MLQRALRKPPPPVSVGGIAWLDADGDGVRDSNEEILDGVTVKIYDADGNLVATTTTDANGFYSFTDLQPDTAYTLAFTAPVGTKGTDMGIGSNDSVDSDVDELTGRVTITTPSTGLNSATEPDVAHVDAGYVESLSVGDSVWIDLDNDGIFDEGEPPLPGVVVTLTKPDGTTVTTTTDENGQYLFTDLPSGTYTISFTLPEGYEAAQTNLGGDDDLDSDGLTVTVTLDREKLASMGGVDLSVDLGAVAVDVDTDNNLTTTVPPTTKAPTKPAPSNPSTLVSTGIGTVLTFGVAAMVLIAIGGSIWLVGRRKRSALD